MEKKNPDAPPPAYATATPEGNPAQQQPAPPPGYAPQGYPPQNMYPPAGGYPPQGGYAPQGGYPYQQPPGYQVPYEQPPPVMTQPGTQTVTVVTMPTNQDPEIQRLRNMNIGFMVFAGIVTCLCGNIIFGGIAFLFSIFAEFDYSAGRKDAGKCKAWTSFGFSCAGVVLVVVMIIVVIAVVASAGMSY